MNVMRNRFEYYKAGYVNVNAVDDREPDNTISRKQAHQLVKFMEKNGILSKSIDDSIRKDDLEITHRHLDIIEKMADNN